MATTPQQLHIQPSSFDERGFPQGNPLTREHLHDVDPLAPDLQDRLDEIMRQA